MKTKFKAPGTATNGLRGRRLLARLQFMLGAAMLTVILSHTAMAYHAVYGAPACPAATSPADESAALACAVAMLDAGGQP